MTAILKYITALVLAAMSLVSCNTDPSLQKYLVDKQEDDRYLKIDLATSLLESNDANLTDDERDILKTVKKVNVVAYPLKDTDLSEYETEKAEVKKIIGQEKYKTLTTMKSGNMNFTLKYLGEEEAIDEVIVFASDNEKGFGVFRLLCDDMRPDQVLKLMNSIERGDLDVSKLSGIGDIFQEM